MDIDHYCCSTQKVFDMTRILKTLFYVFFFLLIIFTFQTYAEQSPTEQLKQLVADLQKNPNDNSLREKIIKHVRTMKPAPEISEEAKRYMSRGIAAMKDAKSTDDFRDAVKEFEKAALATPWFANAYYNLGIAQDKAGIYADAIKSLKLYLLAASDTRDAESVKELIYEIEYRQEKAQKEAVAKKDEEEAKPDFSGVWSDGSVWRYKFLISGRELTITEENSFEGGGAMVYGTGTVDGRNFEGSGPRGGNSAPIRFKGSLSEDNNTVTISSIIAPEVADTQAGREMAQEAIRIVGKKWSTIAWTRVSQ